MSARQKTLLGRGLAACAAVAGMMLLVVFYAVVDGAVERSKSRGVAIQASAAD